MSSSPSRLLSCMAWVALVSLAPLGRAIADGRTGRLQRLSSGLTGCAPNEITIREVDGLNNKSWLAICKGRTYRCASTSAPYGGGWGIVAGSASCTPTEPVQPAVVAPAAQNDASVKRTFDEKRNAAGVVGTFHFVTGESLIIAGTPAVRMGALQLQVTTREAKLRVAKCNELAVVVNGKQAAGAELKSSQEGAALKISAYVDFSEFGPLAKRFPSFALSVCQRQVAFDDAQVAELQKLLVIYSDLAQEEQAKQGIPAASESPATPSKPL